MRYRLRTLVILTAIGPPSLSALWLAFPAAPKAVKLKKHSMLCLRRRDTA